MMDLDKIVQAAKGISTFVVSAHANPDADAIGSTLALTLALELMGKKGVVYNADPVPSVLQFLPGADRFVHKVDGLGQFDAAFAVDCGQISRVGKELEPIFAKHPLLINIDHHQTNEHYGRLNMADPNASSTGELIYKTLTAMNAPIDINVATNLYVAVLTDTGSFRNANSTAEAFDICGRMVRLGVKPDRIADKVYFTQSFGRLKMLGLTLSTLEGRCEGGVASVVARQAMMKSTSTNKDDLEGFVEELRTIHGVEVGVLFREDAPETFKISMRSKGAIDVAEIARHFQGGGHHNAAGCTIKGSIEQVQKSLFDLLLKRLPGNPCATE